MASHQKRPASVAVVSRGLATKVLAETMADMRGAGVPPAMIRMFYAHADRLMSLLSRAAVEMGQRVARGGDRTDDEPCFDRAFATLIRTVGVDLVTHAVMLQSAREMIGETEETADVQPLLPQPRPLKRPRRSSRLAGGDA